MGPADPQLLALIVHRCPVGEIVIEHPQLAIVDAHDIVRRTTFVVLQSPANVGGLGQSPNPDQ